MPSLQIKRGTRAQLNAAATAGTLKAGEPYLITDEARLAVGTATNAYQDYAKLSELVGETKVVLASPVAINSTAFANVTGLSFAVSANQTYHFHAVIFYTSASANTGSRWSLTGPTFSQLAYTSRYTLTATTQTLNFLAAYDAPAAANASSLTAGNIAIIEGFVRPSANGTVQIRSATETANSTITALAGSFLKYDQVV